MFKKTTTSLLAGTILAMSGQAALADGHALTVGYFLEWPMPMMAAKAEGAYAEALGVPVNWVSFDTGTAMSAAMASGDVQISVSQGVPPFVVAASAGQDIQIVDVAVSYAENQGCAVHADLEIDKMNAGELAGKRVAVPLGTAAHYSFIRHMNHFGVDLASLTILDMDPPSGAVALSQKEVDFACGYGGGWARMQEHGAKLLSGEEKVDLGILVFDVTTAPANFVAEESEMLTKFLGVTAKYNEMWNTSMSPDMLAVIAKEAGMELEAAEAAIATMKFPSVEEQLSEAWLGGNAANFMKGVADVFVEAESIPSALESYDATVNVGPLTAVSEM